MEKKIFNKRSAATNQGILRVTREQYLRYKASTSLGRAFLRANSYLPILPLYSPFLGGFRWRHFSEWFMHGDTNPAVVVDARAGLVAIYTDMDSQPLKRFPVLYLFVEKLSLLPTPAKDGDTFAAVSAYGPGRETKKTGRWGLFHSVVVDCVIHDEVRREFTKAKIPDAEWKALKIGLSQLSGVRRPGIYDIVLPDELKAQL